MESNPEVAQQLTLTALSIDQWLRLIVFGALVGALGQAIRSVAGLKKVNDAANSLGASTGEMFDGGRYLRSLLIGGVAGFLAVLATVQSVDSISMQTVLGIMAAGYAGADFVEAFARKHLPEMTNEQVVTNRAAENKDSGAPGPVGQSGNVGPASTDEALG